MAGGGVMRPLAHTNDCGSAMYALGVVLLDVSCSTRESEGEFGPTPRTLKCGTR